MKHFKIITIIFLLFFSISVKSQCLVAPFTESFNSTSKPSCILTSSTAGGPWEFDQFIWVVGCPRAKDHSGNLGSYAVMDHMGVDAGVILELDTIDVSSLTNPYLSFYYYMCGSGYTPLNILAIETYNGTSWVGLDTIQQSASNWTEFTYDLTGHSFGTDYMKIRFRAESGGAWNDFLGGQGLDDISIIESPSCFKPYSLISSDITSSSAKIDWTEKDSATQWEINYDEIGFISGKGRNFWTIDSIPSINLSDLNPATSYAYYIRSICGVGDTSAWSVSTFRTDCPETFTPSYNEAFDKFIPVCWGQAYGGGPITKPVDTTYSFWNSANYLNSTEADGAAKIRMTYANNNNWLLSPAFDLSSNIAYSLFIDAAVTQNSNSLPSDMGLDDTVKVLLSIDSGKTWNSILNWHNNNKPSNTGDVYVIEDLSSYGSVDSRFAIWSSDGTVNDLEDYDFFIGNFEILPPCDTPTIGLAYNIEATSAMLNWKEAGGANKWEIIYDTSGFNVNTARNSVIATDTFVLVNKLRTETNYDFYVRAICRSADSSAWSGVASFRTLICSPVLNPQTTDIRTVDADISWTETGDATRWEIEYDTSGYKLGLGRNSIIIDLDSFATLTSLRANTTYDFYVRSICVAGDSSQWSIGSTFTTADCFGATSLTASPSSNLAELSWVENGSAKQWEIEYDTSGYTFGNARHSALVDSVPLFTIRNLRANTIYDYRVRVICGPGDTSIYSNVYTFTTQSCKSSSNLIANVSSNIADLSWKENGTAIAWELQYDTAGFALGKGRNMLLTSKEVTLSTLRENSNYDWYIRAICGPGDTSNWSPKASFKTFDIVYQCNYSLRLNDQGGDGWTGNILAVKSGGITTNYTLNSGSERYIDLIVGLGDSIALDYKKGGIYSTEVSFELYNAKNEIIYTSGLSPAIGIAYADTVKCPSCLIPSNPTTTRTSKDSAFINWVETATAAEWLVEWDLKGFKYGSASNSMLVNTDTFAILTNLKSLTEYEYNVRSICNVGDTSGFSRPGSFRSEFTCPSGAVCASYTSGDINSDYDFPAVNLESSCPESLMVTIPSGNRIDSIFTIYDMTSVSNSYSWKSEQRSWLYSPSSNRGEADIVSGLGDVSGTVTYERTLHFANKLEGNVVIEMHAGRDLNFGPTGCRSNYVKVDDNTWNIAAYYSPSPSCSEPLFPGTDSISVNTADIYWLDIGAAPEFEVEWDIKGFTAGKAASSMIILADTFATLTGLMPSSSYEFHVRAICGAGDTSAWSDLISFQTTYIPYYTIGEINTVNANGIADSLGTTIITSGIVMGVDLDGNSGYFFTIIDLASGSQEGIAVYSDKDVNSYVVKQGDSIMLSGRVDQFDGLTSLISLNSIELLATNVSEPIPIKVAMPSEETESKWIQIDSMEVVVGAGSIGNSNMTFSKNGVSFTVKVHAETDVDDNLAINPLNVGDSVCSIIGIGGQYDSINPLTSGYELLPQRYQGIKQICGLVTYSEEQFDKHTFEFYPNPTTGEFTIKSSGFQEELIHVEIHDLNGRIVLNEKINNTNSVFQKSFNIRENPSGIYFISLIDGEKIVRKKIILY